MREYKVWLTHFEEEWQRPSRTDWYLMQIAREVACVLSKNPNKIETKTFKLKFEDPDKKPDPKNRDKQIEQSKGIWRALVGAFSGKRNRSRQTGVPIRR